jgi:hypothetical protein
MERRSATGLPPAWLSIGSGLLLVPFLWVTLWTFGQTLAAATVQGAFWRSPPVWWFHIGLLLWSITFGGLRGPALTWLYVFAHEWTHVIFTILCGGRILAWPEVTSRGGHILASKTNHLIALSPYVFPFYSVLIACVFFGLRPWVDLGTTGEWIFYAAIGFTWGFHIVYTACMLWEVQSDLTRNGRFFSLIWIFLVNVLVLAALVLLAAPGIEPQAFFSQWWRNFLSARDWVERVLRLSL